VRQTVALPYRPAPSPMNNERRRAVYLAQTGRADLTPAQRRRIRRRGHKHPDDQSKWTDSALSVVCPKCAAPVGQRCRTTTTGRSTDTHKARTDAAYAVRV